MNGYQISTANERMQADQAIKLCLELGYKVGDAIPLPFDVRTAQAISTTANSYTFPLRTVDPGANDFITNKLVEQQDIFVVFSIGMFISNAAVTSGATLLYPYVNTTIFTSGAAQLLNLWAGNLSVSVNNRTILPGWNLWRHYDAPNLQQQSYVAYSGATAIPLVDSIKGATSGFYPVERGVVINGAARTTWTIELPAAISVAPPANSRIEFLLRGQLLQNVTTIK